MREAVKPIKIVVTGAFNTGKTQFIKTISEIEPVTTEARLRSSGERLAKKHTTVALDFGLVRVDGTPVRLFGTPGQTRFDFMWEALAVGMDGYVVLVDGSQPQAVAETRPVLQAFRRRRRPYVVVITKTDQPSPQPVDELIAGLNLPPGVPVLICDARSKSSVLATLRETLRYLRDARG